MDKRFVKQIIIAFVLISILSGFGFLAYYFNRPGPTCTDGIQNQSEERIDCGGPCISCDVVNLGEVEVIWAKAIAAQNNFYNLAAQIRNPNQNHGSGEVSYRFELYDDADNIVAQRSGRTFILPNQTKYLTQVKVVANRSASQVRLLFDETNWQKIEDYQSPQLFIQQKEYRLLDNEEAGFSQARAVLVNKSNFDFDKVDIDILLFDLSHNLLALNSTEMRTLLSGQERDFIAVWFDSIEGQVSFIEMEPETNIFNPDNYLPTGRRIPERFQEY